MAGLFYRKNRKQETRMKNAEIFVRIIPLAHVMHVIFACQAENKNTNLSLIL